MTDSSREPLAIIKNPSGKRLSYEQKVMAYNIYTKYYNMNNSTSKSVELTAKDVGFSVKTLWNILKELKETGTLTSFSKKRNRSSILDKMNEQQRETFCRIIEEQRKSSLEEILLVIQANGTLPRMSKSTLFKFKRQFDLN